MISYLVVQENRATWLERVLVDKRKDADVVLGADRSGHDGVVVIDHFLKRTHSHGRATQVVNFGSFFLETRNTALQKAGRTQSPWNRAKIPLVFLLEA